jgi:acetyl esterase/lipase
VRYLRANAAKLGIDPDKIGTMGGSAGGHLTLFLGVTGNVPEFEGDGPNKDKSSKVQAVVSFYGPSDFTKSYGRSVDAAEVLPLFLGGDLEHAREMHLRSSPLNWVTPDAAPTMAIQGTKDRYVNYEQSVWIVDRLLAAGVPAELETISGADHGFKGADEERAEVRMIEWFKRWLK